MIKDFWYFLLTFTVCYGYNEFASYSHSLVFGHLPIFNFSHFTSQNETQVPSIITHILNKLQDKEICKKKIFRLKGSITRIEDLLRSYIHSNKLPDLQCSQEAGQLLALLIKRFDRYLISKEQMSKLDKINFKLKDVKQLTKEHLDLYAEVFEKPFIGKEILSTLLTFFAQFVDKGCIKGGYFEFAPIFSGDIAEKFMDCSWMFQCSEYSRDATFLRLIRLGHQNIQKIFSKRNQTSQNAQTVKTQPAVVPFGDSKTTKKVNIQNNVLNSKYQRSLIPEMYYPYIPIQQQNPYQGQFVMNPYQIVQLPHPTIQM